MAQKQLGILIALIGLLVIVFIDQRFGLILSIVGILLIAVQRH